jgi:hypothetical protein
MLPPMGQSSGKGVNIAYIVVAVLMSLMMFMSAIFKLIKHPGPVHSIHEVVGVPLNLLPVLALLEIAGALGLLAGIYRRKLGVAGAAGLVLYFVGAFIAHIRVGDWAGLQAPIVPLLLAIASLTLGILSARRAAVSA